MVVHVSGLISQLQLRLSEHGDSEVRVPAGEDTWRPLGSCQARMMCAMPEESFVTVQSAGHLRDTRQVILALTLDFELSPIEHDA